MPPALLFFLKIDLGFRGLLWFHMTSRIVFFYFGKKCHWDFDRNYTESVDHLGSMDILPILVFPIYKHGMSFHLFMSLIYFLNVLLFLVHKYTRVLNFVKCVFCIYWDNHVILILYSVKVVYHINWFLYVETFLHCRDKSYLVMVYEPFSVLLDSVC